MKTYLKYLTVFERGFLGIIPLAVIGQSCLGSIAVMLILMNGTSTGQMFQLFLIVSACMMFNGAVLSQQKPKTAFNILIFSVLTSVVFSIVNLIALN